MWDGHRYRTARMKGISDIIGILPFGAFFAIEIKTETGKVTSDQNKFLDTINKNGGIGFVARTLGDVCNRVSLWKRALGESFIACEMPQEHIESLLQPSQTTLTDEENLKDSFLKELN